MPHRHNECWFIPKIKVAKQPCYSILSKICYFKVYSSLLKDVWWHYYVAQNKIMEDKGGYMLHEYLCSANWLQKCPKKWWFAYQLRWCNYQIHGLVQCFFANVDCCPSTWRQCKFFCSMLARTILKDVNLLWFGVVLGCYMQMLDLQHLEAAQIRVNFRQEREREREREREKNDVEVQRHLHSYHGKKHFNFYFFELLLNITNIPF